jgi:hypothetical protein
MKNGRCRFHGGKSTGAKSPEGKRNQAMVNTTHGLRTKQASSERRAMRTLLTDCRHAVEQATKGL